MREVLKAWLKTGSGTLGSLLFSAVTVKIIAVFAGSLGIGIFSLLRQMQQTAVSFGTLGGQTAIVQGLSSRVGEQRDSYLLTAFWLTALGATLVAVILLGLAPLFASAVLGHSGTEGEILVRWMVVPVLLAIVLAFVNAVLNGHKAIGVMAWVKVASAGVGVLLAYPVASWVNSGHPVAFVVLLGSSLAVACALALIRAHRAGWLIPLVEQFSFNIEKSAARHFFSISGTTLVTGLMTTGTLLAIRSMIVQEQGLDRAGIFDAAWTVCTVYMMLIISSFGSYYLPTLSGTHDPATREKTIRNLMTLTILSMVPLLTSLISLKSFVMEILYSAEFRNALDVMRWLLIGVYIRASSWVLGIPVLAYPNMRFFFLTELLWNAGFLLSAYTSIYHFGTLEGVGVSFVVLYAVHFLYFIHYARSRFGFRFSGRMLAQWVVGLGLICMSSWVTWTKVDVDWCISMSLILAALVFSWFAATREERGKLSMLILSRLGSRK